MTEERKCEDRADTNTWTERVGQIDSLPHVTSGVLCEKRAQVGNTGLNKVKLDILVRAFNTHCPLWLSRTGYSVPHWLHGAPMKAHLTHPSNY